MRNFFLIGFLFGAWGIASFGQQCDLPLIIESKSSFKPDAKHGYEEFRHDDLPRIHLYLQRVTVVARSFSQEWNNLTNMDTWQNGSYWSPESSRSGSASSSYSAR